MKTKFLFSILLVLTTTLLTACTPEDNKLNRNNQNRFNDQGGANKGLKIGSYGQTIWAVQNVEQVGALVMWCVKQDKSEVIKTAKGSYKDCRIKNNLKSSEKSNSPFQTTERWNVRVNLRELTDNSYQILSASGESENGNSTVVYKSINTYIQYSQKSFELKSDENKNFTLDVTSYGDIGSETETIKYNHQLSASGSLEEHSWNLSGLNHELMLLNRGQKFEIQSQDIKINWVTPYCGEASGKAKAVEVNKSEAEIELTPVIAKLVVQAGRKGWTQAIRGCLPENSRDESKRHFAHINLEFLFY